MAACPNIIAKQDGEEWVARYASNRFPITFNSATQDGAIALATKHWEVEQLSDDNRKRFYQIVLAKRDGGKSFEEAFMSTALEGEKLTVTLAAAPRPSAPNPQIKIEQKVSNKKSILVKRGTYRNQPVKNQSFPLLKPFQAFTNKKGGFVTVDGSTVFGKQYNKIRITVGSEKELEEVA